VIADVWTVLWKEWKQLTLRQGRGLGRGLLGTLMIPLVFGIFLPWQTGREWVTSPAVLIYWAWVPLFLVSSVVADSFAGERERHTLEALLASRLSDRAILLGKLAAAVSYGWGVTMVSLLLGLVTVNLAHGRGELLLYPAEIAAGIVLLSFLGAGLMASIGVLVSLRSPTVRQAQQVMSLATMALLFGVIYGFRALPPALQEALLRPLLRVGATQVVLLAATVLILLDVVFLVAAIARFQRARLTLD
jgi:ABC-2 type transport system permease protein